jgi:hypothetical protein
VDSSKTSGESGKNYENPKFTPQMDDTETTDFTAKVSADKQSTTVFYEAGAQIVGAQSQSTAKVSTYVEQEADIKSFLRKPVLISSGAWTTSQANNANLATGAIAPLLSSVGIWKDKISGFNLFRGDFMIKVQLNASPFQQGKMILHYLPCYANMSALNTKFFARVNKQLIQKVQHPHVEIDCRQTSVTFRIPYIAPTHFYPLKEGLYDWGTWYLDVFSALQTGTAAPASQLQADYAIYAFWENVELAAPTVPQSSNKEKRIKSKNVVSETAENSGPIEEGLRKIGTSATIFSEVPILSDFAKPVEWAADLGARLAHIWGWSKPRELDGVGVRALQLARYAGTADGPSLALPGGVIVNNRLETIDYASYTNEDEMSLPYLLNIPTYMGEFSWASNAGQGFSLLSQSMGPIAFKSTGTDVISTHTVNYDLYAPLGYLARFFKYWRGGIDVTFKFIKTQMHSGRLQMTFTPLTTIVGTTPTVSNSAYAMRAVVDIRTEDEVTFTLPFLVYSDYLNTVTATGGLGVYMGQLDVDVLNDLRGPESVSQTIAVQWFVKASKDFEFAVPTNNLPSTMPYIPQASNEEKLHGQDSVREIASDVIGNMSLTDDATMHSARCIGERVLSIKSLLLRNSAINCYKNNGYIQRNFSFQPLFLSAAQMDTGTGVVKTPDFGGDLLSWMAPMYMFMRGGTNFMWKDTGTSTNNTLSGNFPGAYSYSGNAQPYVITPYPSSLLGTNANPQTLINTNGVTNWPVNPGNWTTDVSVAYQHVPYHAAFPFTPTYQYNGIDTFVDPTMPSSTFTVVAKAAFVDPILQRAVADDFQLLFFIGCPPVATSYV